MIKYKKDETDPDIILRTDTTETPINLSDYLERSERILERVNALPNTKKKPDNETLEFFNMNVQLERDISLQAIKIDADLIHSSLKRISDAGLLPEKYKSTLNNLEKL